MEHNDYNLNDEEPKLPLDPNGKHSFELPSGYFASFEDKLRQKLELADELNEFPLLLSIPKNNLFTVPGNYFMACENALELKAELADYTQLQNIRPFVAADLEAEYIDRLQSSVNYKVELAEEIKEYKKLYVIDKVNSFIASDAYFDGIAERVKDKVYASKGPRVSILDSLKDVIFGKKVAFAFGIAFLVSLSLYFYKSSEKPLEISDCKTLACLEKQEILNNNNVISNFDEDQLIDLVDVNTLNEQLNPNSEKTHTDKINVDSISEDDLLDEL
ncbi:MAG: hypothetical protein V4580_17515 [Bacteroidota bacterium]